MGTLRRTLPLSVLALGLTAVDAAATTLHAAPDGTRVTTPCELAAPCRIDYAMTAAGFGDDVSLASGDYFQTGSTPWPTLPDVKVAVRVHGAAGGPRPVLHGLVPTVATPFVEIRAGGTLSDVEVRSAGKPGVNYTYGVSIDDGGALDRAIVRLRGTSGVFGTACSMGAGSVRDTVCHGSGEGTVEALAGTSGNPTTYRVRNVTAVTTAESGAGIRVGVSNQTSTMEVTNAIARGTTADVEARAGLSAGKVTLRIDHSNWAAQASGGAGSATIVAGDGNQFATTFAPVTFTDAASGDFRPVPGTATIDAGGNDPLNGELDVDGAARTLGTATDMGAYEQIPSAPPDPATPAAPDPAAPATPEPSSPAATAPPATAPAPDRVAPRLTRLTVTKPGRRSRSRAVTVGFRLSEAARVTLRLAQPVKGRKRLRRRGAVVVRATAGANRVRLTRARGRYRLTATAVDAAGNRSAAKAKRFTITR